MKIWTKQGEINLSKNHFVASGGEGHVFAKDGVAYKIYTDPSKMIPSGKIQELSAISDPNVIRPLEVIVDQKKHPVGYSTRFIRTPTPYASCLQRRSEIERASITARCSSWFNASKKW